MEGEKKRPERPEENQSDSGPTLPQPSKKSQSDPSPKRQSSSGGRGPKAAGAGTRPRPDVKAEARKVDPDPASFVAAAARANQDFFDKLHAAWQPLDLGQSAHEAEMELQQALARFDAPHQELERCEARAAYLRALRRLHSPERQSAQIAFAFSRYLAAIRGLLSRPDLDSLDPGLISALGESIAWAGYYASQRPAA
jgi:hypothetical protein